MLHLVTAAYQVLSDPVRRSTYDRELRAGIGTPATEPPRPPQDVDAPADAEPAFAWRDDPVAGSRR